MGTLRKPVVFGIDFLKEKGFVIPYSERFLYDTDFRFGEIQHESRSFLVANPLKWEVEYYPFKEYKKGFELVHNRLKRGDSYLTNYTCQNKVRTSANLSQIYECAKSRYAFRMGNDWVCFSPERFVRAKDNYIFSNPMKGTIAADLPGAAQKLIQNEKEKAEHNTIVDLIRNDLSQVATQVDVLRFRYLEAIQTQQGKLLQASSEIRGRLPQDWNKNLGDWLSLLLPAGSICGAPKRETLAIINEAETYKRNFYTGIIGFFDGYTLDTAVAIRFIEQQNGQFFYKTGGGITHMSNLEDEYNEMKQKIYVPIS